MPLIRTKRIADRVGGHEEGVLADVDLHAGMQGQDDQFAGSVAREGDPSRAVGDRDDVRHTASIRFMPPAVFMAESGVPSSFHSNTWCSKKTESPRPG